MLNEALRLLRVYHDLTALELAEQLGISPSYLSEIESGKKEPSLQLIRRYAEIFKTSRSSILFFAEDLEGVGKKKKFKDLIRKKTIQFLQKIEDVESSSVSS
jgi:transcriptional regulator with XRE-family HTH domain